jgi:hypothetical protein
MPDAAAQKVDTAFMYLVRLITSRIRQKFIALSNLVGEKNAGSAITNSLAVNFLPKSWVYIQHPAHTNIQNLLCTP